MPPAAFFLAGATVAEPSTLLGTGLRALVGFALKKACSSPNRCAGIKRISFYLT